MVLGMGMGAARTGCELGSPCHCLSVLLCGGADKLLLHNLTDCN